MANGIGIAADTGREQRRDRRQQLLLRADAPDQRASFGWTEDISAGGVFVRGLSSLKRGQILRLRLSFPGLLEPVDVLGDVVWSGAEARAAEGGCGFRVWSALDRQRLQALAESAQLRPLPRTSPYRVLIVESEHGAAARHRLAIEELSKGAAAQLDVELVRSWDEAHAAIERQRLDMLVVGLSATSKDGALVLDYARHNGDLADTAIVALSNGEDGEADGLARSVADAVLSKPIELGRVLETAGHLLGRRSTKQTRVAFL